MAKPTDTTTTTTAKPVNDSVINEIMRSAQLVWRLMLDSRLVSKLIVPLIILYVLSPLDVIPDFLIVLGQLDDIALIYFGIKLFFHLVPADVLDEHRRALGDPTVAPKAATSDYMDATYRVVDDK